VIKGTSMATRVYSLSKKAGQFDEAHRFGRLSLQKAEEGNAGIRDVRTKVTCNSFITNPCHDSLEPLIQAHRIIIEKGYIEALP
jgi:hypothetical protein